MFEKFKRLFGARDMTVGKPASNLIQFTIPLLLGNVVQLLYSTVDSIVVGNYVGDAALAAIGVSMPVINLMLVLFMGLATGSSIMASQFYGAKNYDQLSRTVGTTVSLSVLATFIIMAMGYFTTGPILHVLDTPADVAPLANEYLLISFITIVGPVFYNMIAGILRGLGDSVMPLLFLVIACLTNIALDLVFVIAFDWGVAGVAWATAIAQALSAILCLIKLFSMKNILTLRRGYFKLNKELSLRLLKLGLPSGLSQGVFSIAMLLVQGLTNTFGTMFIAVSTVVMRVDSFVIMPSFTFATTMTTFTGQNMGAGRLDRVKEGTRKGLIMGLSVSVVLTIALLFLGEGLIMLFTDTPGVISYGALVLRILSAGYIGVCINQILCGVMRGAGETVAPMWIAIITTVFIRVPLSYGLVYLTKSEESPLGNPMMIYVSMLVAWVLGAALAGWFYKRGGWKQKAVVQRAEESSRELFDS